MSAGWPTFLDVPNAAPHRAAVILLPLPFEGAVSYGRGTAEAPAAIWRASAQVELWDPETRLDLAGVAIHGAQPLVPEPAESSAAYLDRVQRRAGQLHEGFEGLLIGVGGDHSLTPPLVRAACGARGVEPGDLTVVHLDAHADLRDEYEGTPLSHACAMARVLETGASVISVGIRSTDEAEFLAGRSGGRVSTFWAQDLDRDESVVAELHARLAALDGPAYVTFDIDALEVHLCPATGTPEPGGLGWWFALDVLRRVFRDNPRTRLVGCDVVETVPQAGTRVNEFTAARLIAKIIAYDARQG